MVGGGLCCPEKLENTGFFAHFKQWLQDPQDNKSTKDVGPYASTELRYVGSYIIFAKLLLDV